MTIETKEKGKETKIAMKGNSEVAEQEVDLEEEAVAANNITVDGLRTNVKYTENTNGPIAERTQRETIMIRTQEEVDEDEAEKPVEVFKAEATMEAVEGIINLTTHKIISKQIKNFTTDHGATVHVYSSVLLVYNAYYL